MAYRQSAAIIAKRAIGKLKKLVLSPLLSTALRSRNQPTIKHVVYTDLNLSLDDIDTFYPTRVRKLFQALTLHTPKLNPVQNAIDGQDFLTACGILVQYYQDSDIALWINRMSSQCSHSKVDAGDAILQDILSFQALQDTVPRNEYQQINWTHQGPNSDREWAWFLNRHYHFLDLLSAYKETGNLGYIHHLNAQVIDWILSSPSQHSPSMWAQWRGLEVVFRIDHWSQIFYGLQQVPEFTSAARILMLSSILDHAYYLRHLHSWGSNWLIKEMYGLATIALCWPEFKSSERWLKYACDRILKELPEQVYPDGVQKELTSHYHRAVLLDLQSLANLLTQAGREIPEILALYLEHMWNYLAYSLRPDGHGALNNDSDRDDNRSLVIEAAETHRRPDWLYIATNSTAGEPPQGLPSSLFAWAGQMIMRSGWQAHAHWAFFDIGPMGIYYHIHNDKLHLSIAAYGRDLLVDGGRYSYVRDKFWHYFRGSSSHNVVLVDGQGQKSDVREALRPMADHWAIEPRFDFSRGTFKRGFTKLRGKARHTRAVVYLRGKYWVVVDQITTNRPRLIEPLWHFHPDCTVTLEGDSATSVDPELGNLRIIPCAKHPWSVRLVQGQEDPVQGWWSGTYNQKRPSPTAIYAAEIQKSTIFAWILFPAQGPVPTPTVELRPAAEGAIVLCVQTSEQTEDIIAVRLSGTATLDLGQGLTLDGDCAILQTGQMPLVAHGAITDTGGNIIAEHHGSPGAHGLDARALNEK